MHRICHRELTPLPCGENEFAVGQGDGEIEGLRKFGQRNTSMIRLLSTDFWTLGRERAAKRWLSNVIQQVGGLQKLQVFEVVLDGDEWTLPELRRASYVAAQVPWLTNINWTGYSSLLFTMEELRSPVSLSTKNSLSPI